MNVPEYSPLRSTQRRGGPSKAFVIAVVAIGLLLAFTLGLVTAGSLGGTDSPQLYDEDVVTALFDGASPAVVEIEVTQRTGGFGVERNGSGSGFFVDRDGHIVTNHHVVSGADEILVKLQDGRTLEAVRLGTSPADDLALLQVDPDEVAGIRPLSLADSSQVRAGQLAVAIGSPFQNFNSVTVGVVSGTGRGTTSVLRRPIPDMIQTDAPLNSGNSGGPLLNSDGEVIGVNSSVRTASSRGLDDFRIGFAVPSNTVRDLLPELLESQQVRRPWLGISGGGITRDMADSLGIASGIFVTSVFADSPAERAGLIPFRTLRGDDDGDVITAVDGQQVSSVEDMVSYFNTRKPGDEVTLSVFRDRGTIEIEVTLARWPDT